MGWTSFAMHEPIKDWYERDLNKEYRLLDIALVHRTKLYAAVQNIKTGAVICDVCLINWAPKCYDNFAIKSIGETSGPTVVDCPLRIMKLLTPIEEGYDYNGYAKEWRERVYAFHARAKSIKGDCIVKVDRLLTFNRGGEFEYFKKIGKEIYGCIKKENNYFPIIRVSLNLNRFNFEVITT